MHLPPMSFHVHCSHMDLLSAAIPAPQRHQIDRNFSANSVVFPLKRHAVRGLPWTTQKRA